jgi:hypothetical protein
LRYKCCTIYYICGQTCGTNINNDYHFGTEGVLIRSVAAGSVMEGSWALNMMSRQQIYEERGGRVSWNERWGSSPWPSTDTVLNITTLVIVRQGGVWGSEKPVGIPEHKDTRTTRHGVQLAKDWRQRISNRLHLPQKLWSPLHVPSRPLL